MTYLEEITKGIEWYRRIDAKPERELIEKLIKLRRRIACNLYLMRQDVADAKAEKEKAYFNRKKHFSDRFLALKAEGWSATDAEKRAQMDNAKHQDNETAAIRHYEQMRVLVSAVGEVLNALSTDIRVLEEEYRRSSQAQPA